jgi:hypothetical protein
MLFTSANYTTNRVPIISNAKPKSIANRTLTDGEHPHQFAEKIGNRDQELHAKIIAQISIRLPDYFGISSFTLKRLCMCPLIWDLYT